MIRMITRSRAEPMPRYKSRPMMITIASTNNAPQKNRPIANAPFRSSGKPPASGMLAGRDVGYGPGGTAAASTRTITKPMIKEGIHRTPKGPGSHVVTQIENAHTPRKAMRKNVHTLPHGPRILNALAKRATNRPATTTAPSKAPIPEGLQIPFKSPSALRKPWPRITQT